MPKAKYWCFTSFSEVAPVITDEVQYLTYQKERCPSSGKSHWQGYIELKVTGTQKDIKAITGKSSHVEPSRSSAAIAYCHKEETRIEGPYEFGEKSKEHGRGSRSDLGLLGKRVRERGGIEGIAESDPGAYIKYHRGLHALRQISIKARDRTQKPDVRVYIGASGSGKTRSVYDEFGDNEVYAKNRSTKWWDGYDGQACILIDDFMGSEAIPIEELLTICDRYPYLGETKGGHVRLGQAVIIFTTTLELNEWYQGMAHKWSQKITDFERRVTETRRFNHREEL